MSISPLRLRLVPLAVASLLGVAALQASATPQTFGNVTLDAGYLLGATTGTLADGLTAPGASLYSLPDGADFYLSAPGGYTSNSVFFHTYGATGSPTYFGARVSARGTFSAYTSTNIHLSFTNTSAAAQLFNFGFNVAGGEVGLSGTGSGIAKLLLKVTKNGTDVRAYNETTITETANVFGCTDAGSGSLDSYMGCGASNADNSSASGGPFNVDFGMIGSGESFTLDYDLIATISGDLSGGLQEHWVCGYGGGLERIAVGDGQQEGNNQGCSQQWIQTSGEAVARSGDPFDLNQANFRGTFSNSVPEPGSLALVGVAMAALAAAGRRRKTPIA